MTALNIPYRRKHRLDAYAMQFYGQESTPRARISHSVLRAGQPPPPMRIAAAGDGGIIVPRASIRKRTYRE
jgi:hypothetical protein